MAYGSIWHDGSHYHLIEWVPNIFLFFHVFIPSIFLFSICMMGHANSFFLDLVTLIHRNSPGGNLQVMYCVQQNMAQQYPFFLMYWAQQCSPAIICIEPKSGRRPIQNSWMRKKLHQASSGTRHARRNFKFNKKSQMEGAEGSNPWSEDHRVPGQPLGRYYYCVNVYSLMF